MEDKELSLGLHLLIFEFPSDAQIWGVLSFSPDELDPSQRGARWLTVIGRLAPGITLQQAQARSSQVAADIAKKFPEPNEGIGSSIQPFQGFLIKNSKPALLVLWAAVGFVLLIACVNVTNLLLAQAARRESEVAIRTALGAGRVRLIRQFVVESLVLSLVASVAGLDFGDMVHRASRSVWVNEFAFACANRYWTPRF